MSDSTLQYGEGRGVPEYIAGYVGASKMFGTQCGSAMIGG
jgi:hypothetical protein